MHPAAPQRLNPRRLWPERNEKEKLIASQSRRPQYASIYRIGGRTSIELDEPNKEWMGFRVRDASGRGLGPHLARRRACFALRELSRPGTPLHVGDKLVDTALVRFECSDRSFRQMVPGQLLGEGGCCLAIVGIVLGQVG
jgi:hypothetical protein